MDRAGRIFVVLAIGLTTPLLWPLDALVGSRPNAAFAAPAVDLSADAVGRCEKLELTVTGWHPESFGDVPWDH